VTNLCRVKTDTSRAALTCSPLDSALFQAKHKKWQNNVKTDTEFIGKQDGAEKQDCERNAAKRWLATHSERVLRVRPIYLG